MAGKAKKKPSNKNTKAKKSASAERGVIDNIWGIVYIIAGIFLELYSWQIKLLR